MRIDLAIQEGIYAARARKEMIARIKFEQVTEIAPDEAEGWLWLAWSCVSPRDAVDYLRKAQELEPDNQLIKRYLDVARAFTVLDAGQLSRLSSGTPKTSRQKAAATAATRPEAEREQAPDPAKVRVRVKKARDAKRTSDVTPASQNPVSPVRVDTTLPAAGLPSSPEPQAAGVAGTESGHDDHTRDEFQKAAAAFAQVAKFAKANLADEREVMDEVTETQIQEMAADIQEISDEIRHGEWGDSAKTDAYYDASKATILVVDDSATIRKTLTILLQAEGYNVVTVEDGVEASQFLVRSFPNLILLDVNMPRMSGYRLCKLIKAHPETSMIPVVMISGSVIDRIRCTMVGCEDYISKPFETDVLLDRVRQYINMSITN